MEIETGHALFQVFKEERFAFGYSALFTDELTARLLDLADAVVESGITTVGHRGKLSFLLVEAYQNIIRHRAVLPEAIARGEGRCLFVFRSRLEGHNLVAINPVRKSDVPGLQAKLEAIKGLDKAELKDLFRNRLRAEHDGGRGAGLGFIEMARRSENDLGYLLRGLGPDNAIFAFGARLGSDLAYRNMIGDAAALHGTVVMNDILFFQTGHSIQRIKDTLMEMIANDVDERTELAQRWVAAYALICDALGAGEGPQRGVTVVGRAKEGLIISHGRVLPAPEARAFCDMAAGVTQRMRDRSMEERGQVGRACIAEGVPPALVELAAREGPPISTLCAPVESGTLVLLQAIV